MPKAPRNAEDVDAVRMQIIDAAKGIICKDGFNQLSMRKLASVLNMTAANIYNYYANKDEIYLGVQTAGFSLLQEQFYAVTQQCDSSLITLETFIRVYIEFGINNPDYYDVMLGGNTPKYVDYVGTNLEGVAFNEKKTALAIASMTTDVIVGISGIDRDEALYRTLQAWTTLHGIVSLHNNRLLQEMDIDVNAIIERICQDLLLPLKPKSNTMTSTDKGL
ncbi:MAG: TetR/AcrR family transcriptional regulator [Pseudomonadales bacterium]|nr:TetR/AcrR family transcriptional regulator [Pseudomonadales bacterium]